MGGFGGRDRQTYVYIQAWTSRLLERIGLRANSLKSTHKKVKCNRLFTQKDTKKALKQVESLKNVLKKVNSLKKSSKKRTQMYTKSAKSGRMVSVV